MWVMRTGVTQRRAAVMGASYSGYLSPHLDLIRELHEKGAGTREIAERIYAGGARGLNPGSRERHLLNLQTMTLYALKRLGLHTPRLRVLDLKRAADGSWGP